jgi:hypothetical protein
MRRRTFDALATAVGAMLTVVLLVAGGMLMWGSIYTTNNVHNQLAAQKIYFPAKGSAELANPAISKYLNQYAGQQLLTGSQAEVWADHYIAVHLQEIGGGKTYAQLSAASLADPGNKALASQVQLVFQGETLRGLLLNAYAFGTIGKLTFIASIASFILAAGMALLTLLGVLHYRKVDEEEEIFSSPKAEEPVPVNA